MTAPNACYWKCLWRWITSHSLTEQELTNILDKNVVESLRQGLSSYRQLKPELYTQLQTKYPDQTRLLSVVQTLQNYIDVDCFQVWDILKHYLCDIYYGTPDNALKNVAFVDTRPSFLLPNTWNFYYSERLFLLKLLMYIIQFKSDSNHKYKEIFTKVISDIQIKNLRTSLITQFEKLLAAVPPPRRIQTEFGNDCIRQEWAEANMREQLTILQILLLINYEESFPETDFNKLFLLFRKHNFGKNQSYSELLEERHRETCHRVMYMELGLILCILDRNKINDLSSWINNTKETVEFELMKLEPYSDCSVMLIAWMMLTLQSVTHAKLFESQYQHYGATALKLRVFEFTHQMINSNVFSDNSQCSKIVRQRVFGLLNDLCDKFDGDGTLSHQPGIMQLCSELLQDENIASQFWSLQQKEENYGVVSLWNTALEYFPYNFSALSILAAGLAQAGTTSVRNLLGELKNLPVYTEIYNPTAVPIMSLCGDDAIIGREYCPIGPAYKIEVGSKATVMERKEGTMIHFRTPYSYWTVLNSEIEKTLDRRQVYQHLHVTVERVYEGSKVLKAVLKSLVLDKKSEIPKSLVAPSEGVFDVLIRFMRAESPPLVLLVECLNVCTALIPIFAKEIHLRLINTGLLPRIINRNLSHVEYATGASLDSAAVGSYLVTIEQTQGTYSFLAAYIDMLCAFYKASDDERITIEILLPGLMLILREVFPNVSSWRYNNMNERKSLIQRCTKFLTLILEETKKKEHTSFLRKTCVYSLLHTENALELLKITSIGKDGLEKLIQDETDWISGANHYCTTIQHCIAIVMFVLKQKSQAGDANEMTPLEMLVFAQNKQKDTLRVVPKVTSYINNAFSKSLSVLSCRLLKKFAEGFQMSLFSSLDMTAYQVRMMFLDRLRDENETIALKNAILEFVTTCIGKQPGLTEAFFMMNHEKAKADEKNNDKVVKEKLEPDDTFEGILGYMADYLGFVKTDAKLLHSSILGSLMALFHALWKNNMQILVKKLREHPKFWEYMTSPLFSEIQPGLRTYGQIFNVLGIEMFVSRGKLDPSLQVMLEQLFDVNKKHLDTWINYVFSFEGRNTEEAVDVVPTWLALLTSWKDFTTISCKCLPINLNIAHKSKMVAPCMSALLHELDELRDGRLVVILAELYVIMLANWKDDCFDNRKASAKQIENLLTNTAIVYEDLHPRATHAILSICTVAISSLDYEIKANPAVAQNIIRSVTNINSLELEKLLNHVRNNEKGDKKQNGPNEISSIVLSLAMLEQCLELYDDTFAGLSQWFQSTKFINKLLCCLQLCLQNRTHQDTSLAALRCLTAYARGPFSSDLLTSDVDQFLWLQLLPPKFDTTTNGSDHSRWKPQEWWRVYSHSLDFITMMLMKHGEFFADAAITFMGVHVEQMMEAVLLMRQTGGAGGGVGGAGGGGAGVVGGACGAGALEACAAALALVVQLLRFEPRWRTRNINSMLLIMRSISAGAYQTVSQLLRTRRPEPGVPHDDSAPALLHRLLEILLMATLCLLAFSPDLLSLLADPTLDLERWQPLVELHFGAPKISYEPFPQLTFGTILSAICLLVRSLNHTYHSEEGSVSGVVGGSGGRSPRGRRRACSCSSPGGAAGGAAAGGVRGESVGSVSSAASALPAPNPRLLAAAAHAATTLLAQQALLAIREASVPARHKQLVRRELASELPVYHDFVRKRILCAAHARPHLQRNKLGAWPLRTDERELLLLDQVRRSATGAVSVPSESLPPPAPKRAAHESMRELLLRKHFLDRFAQTPTKPPSPVSHSTPASHSTPVSHSTPAPDRKRDGSRAAKRVSWAETTRESDDLDCSMRDADSEYSSLTDVQINNDEDYFHFMSILFLYICQTDL